MKTNKNQVVKMSLAGLLAAAFLCPGVQQAKAAVIAQYTFTGNSDAATTTGANAAAGSFTPGSGISANDGFSTTGNPAPSRYALGSDTGTALNTSDYFAFTVTANSGYFLNFNGYTLTFDGYNYDTSSGDQTANWAVRTSVSGFGNANYSSGTMNESWTAMTPTTFSGAGYNGLTSFEVRIYMWDPSSSLSMRFDNVTLNGAVVPEPVNVALGVFGLCAVGVGVGRRMYAKVRS